MPIDIEQGIKLKQIIEEDDLGEYNIIQITKEEQKAPQEPTKIPVLEMSLMSQQRREENKRKREEEAKIQSNYGIPKEPLRTLQDLDRRPKIPYKKVMKKTEEE